MDSSITVGITGGIGAGKSIVCRILSIMGYPVFYSDTEARRILDAHPEAIRQVTALFGPGAYKNNQLDRSLIAQKVFNDQTLRTKLNEIAHPLVREAFQLWKLRQNAPVVFNEAAILFETGAYANFSKTILVTAPEELRIKRVQERDDLSVSQIKARINTQWPDNEKEKFASFVVVNDDKKALLPQINTIIQKITP